MATSTVRPDRGRRRVEAKARRLRLAIAELEHGKETGEPWPGTAPTARNPVTTPSGSIDKGIVIARQDGAGNLVMAVDPTTLPPDLFRKLFPSGKAGSTPETVRLSVLREQSAITVKTAKKKLSPAFVAHTWKKGQSGNPAGRPSMQPFTEAIRRLLRDEVEQGATGFDVIARAMLTEALAGNVKAAQYLTDRLEGRPIQSVLVSKQEDATPIEERLKAALEYARQRMAEVEKGGK